MARSKAVSALQVLVKQVCVALKVHVRIEEEIFYPAVRRAIKDKDLIEEAQVEHDSAKILIRQLERMQPEMFPKVRRARVNLAALGKKLMARKITLAP